MPQKTTVRADYAGVSPSMDVERPFMIRGKDRRDSDRPVVVHMTYDEMIEARDALTQLIDNPPSHTRLFTNRTNASDE